MAGLCAQCGSTIGDGARFCASCGNAAIVGSGPVTMPPPQAATSWSAPGAPVAPAAPPPDSPVSGPPSYAPPPFTAPQWTPPYAAPAQPPTSGALAAWLQGLMWASGALFAISALLFLQVRAAASDFYDAIESPFGGEYSAGQTWVDREDTASVALGLSVIVSIATAVLLIIWAYQLTRSTNRHQPVQRRWSPGWAIGGWFIPVANFIVCPMILIENERIASAAARRNGDVAGWQSESVRPTAVWWFVLWAVATTLRFLGNSSFAALDGSTIPDRSEVLNGYLVFIIGSLVAAVASAVGALTVRRLTALDHAAVPARIASSATWSGT